MDEAHRVDAVPLVRGGGETFPLEHMAQVRAAGRTPHLGADDSEGTVLEQFDGFALLRRPEGRPAAVRIELSVGGEELCTAPAARVGARFADLLVLAATRAFGPSFAKHVVLESAEALFPLILADSDGVTGA